MAIEELGALLGYRLDGRPIYLIGGATGPGPDDDQDDDLDDDQDDDLDDDQDDAENGTEGGSGDDDEFTPPDKAEWERVQAALTKANGEAKKHRLKARQLTREREEATRKAAADAAAAAGKTEEHERALAAAAEAEQRYKPIAIRSAARAAFLQAGLQLGDDPERQEARIKRAVRLLDMDEIEVDEDGEVVGLDTQIDSIREEYSELFTPAESPVPPPRRRAPKIDAGDRSPGGVDSAYESLSTGEKIAQQVLGTNYR